MKKQIARKKLALATETVRRIGESKLDGVVGAGYVASKQNYGVAPCPTVLCGTEVVWNPGW